MPPYSRLPFSIMNSLYARTDLHALARGLNLERLPLHEWPHSVLSLFRTEVQTVDADGLPWLLQESAAAYGTKVRPSSIRGAGLGVFATRHLEKDTSILSFFGQLVYHDLQIPAKLRSTRLSSARYRRKVVPPVLATTAAPRQETALQVRTGAELWEQSSSAQALTSMVRTPTDYALQAGRVIASSPVWIVPADCCAGGKVNDPYPDLVANTEYEQQCDPVGSVKDLVRAGIGFLRVRTAIEVGKEVVVSYGRRHPVHARDHGLSSAA